MIINNKTKDGFLIENITKGSKKLVKVKCDLCGSLLGREKTEYWVRYNKISIKNKHLCKSCTTRKQFGYEQPKEKEVNGTIYRFCNKCKDYKLKTDFWAGEGKNCKKCDKERFDKYYDNDDNKNKILKKVNLWSKNNKDKIKIIKKRFNESNPKKLKKYQKKWEQSPKGKAYSHSKRVKKKELMRSYRTITSEDIIALKKEIVDELGDYVCPYCGDKMNTGEYKKTESIEHMIPIIHSKEYPEYDINDYNNLTYCCLSCNSSKDNKIITEYKEVPFLIKKFKKLKEYPKDILSYRKKHFKLLDSEERNELIEKIFKYYRSNGFPYYKYDKEKRIHIFKLLKNFNIKDIDEEQFIGWSRTALGLASYYHPHMFEIKTTDENVSPMINFNNDEVFKRIINKRIQTGDDIRPYGIRKALSMFNVQSVSNFRSTVAKFIYETYGNKGDILDFSAGFSGRLLGAIASNIKSYTGLEPSKKTYKGLLNTYEDLKEHTNVNCYFYKIGAEEYCQNKYDLIFSSPPYFNLEKYSDESTQSYIKFPTYELWLNKFLHQIIKNAKIMLKNNGIFAINIANIKNHNIYEDTLNLGLKYFKLIEVRKMKLSSISKSYKVEPILIFQK